MTSLLIPITFFLIIDFFLFLDSRNNEYMDFLLIHRGRCQTIVASFGFGAMGYLATAVFPHVILHKVVPARNSLCNCQG